MTQLSQSPRAFVALRLMALLVLPAALCAQVGPLPTPAATAKQLQGDYAVPENPAMLMLNLDASKLLRPSSVQELTASLGKATSGFSVIPDAYGLEFSPGLLMHGDHLSISDYQANPMLYRFRTSFAAKKDSATNRSQVSIGMRMSFSDQSDLRTNRDFLAAADLVTATKVDSMRILTFAKSRAKLPVIGPYTPEQQKQIDSLVKALGDSIHGAVGTTVEAGLAAMKRAREAAMWNASVLDFAAGLRLSSADSVGKGTRVDGVASWLTKGIPLGTVSQLLLGARGAYERDSIGNDMRGVGDAIARAYLGSNTYKMSVEASTSWRSSAVPMYAAKLGGELEAGKSIWIEIYAGWSAQGSRSAGLSQGVKFHLAPPNS